MRARELGADWVLCCDPDERFEQAFLERLREIIREAEATGQLLRGLRFRELWDGHAQFRVDGVWGQKQKFILFPVQDQMSFRNLQYHSPWFPNELDRPEAKVLMDCNLYHLRMIRREDRVARRDKYNRLDPNKQLQPIGYGYLAEEEGAQVIPIPPGKEYAHHTLPANLRYYSADGAWFLPRLRRLVKGFIGARS